MRITREGQITIPEDIRERLGLLPDTEVELEVVDDFVRVRKAQVDTTSPGWRLVQHMTGRATSGLTTDEIMTMTRSDECD